MEREGLPRSPEGNAEAERGLVYAGQSEASEEHPNRNEDLFFADLGRGAFGVFDGMTHPAGGGIAARVARERFQELLRQLPEDATLDQAKEWMVRSFKAADASVREYPENHPVNKEIGTTATVLKFVRGEGSQRTAVVGHVGDSRVSLLRNGRITTMTLDDSYSLALLGSREERRARQAFYDRVTNLDEFPTDRELRLFMERHGLTNVVGGEAEPTVLSFDVQPGDRILLSSDGIHDNLTTAEIEKIITDASQPDEATSRLFEAAVARSHEQSADGKHEHLRAKVDDMTAIVVDYKP
ncbi:MAG: serine/threonine-protein phosphatase [Candidatus Kerfeldbacteria bacterium]|nr:serine/threonine-protein phosphatase [Candidatus Kerfeldbacteria bacterium]